VPEQAPAGGGKRKKWGEGVNWYDEVRADVDTGDLVLFSGKGGISAGIKWFTGCKWSHIGMALRLAEWDMVLLWESTPFGTVADAESGHIRQGVQLTPLSERIRSYEGDVAIRHLDVRRTPEMLRALRTFREELKGRPFEQSKLELIKSVYEGPFGANEEDLSSLFCSELVAETYQRMGLLPEEPPSNEYTPADFAPEYGPPLLKGSLGPDRPLKAARAGVRRGLPGREAASG